MAQADTGSIRNVLLGGLPVLDLAPLSAKCNCSIPALELIHDLKELEQAATTESSPAGEEASHPSSAEGEEEVKRSPLGAIAAASNRQ